MPSFPAPILYELVLKSLTQFFDVLHLLIQVMSLNEVTQVYVVFVSGQFVQFQ